MDLGVQHPAKYSDCLLPYFKKLLGEQDRILDPFGGTGKIKKIYPHAVYLEIEPEWANLNGGIVGDATDMPFCNEEFTAICTSPTYGNRMADTFEDHQKEKKYVRNTYFHKLGRKLHPNNSGGMQWGEDYKDLHEKAWRECYRVLKNDGLFLLNISDHIRKGKIISVTDWHIEILHIIGFSLLNHLKIETRRNRMGQNREIRVPYESVILFKKRSS